MQSSKKPENDATRVALVLDAGGARSAYQVGALEVLLPALAERGTRPRLLIGTSAGALLTGALTATAHLEPEDQIARLNSMLGQTTKQNVMRPLWRQCRKCSCATHRRHWACRSSVCAGCLAVNRSLRPLGGPSTGQPCTATSRIMSSSPRPSRRHLSVLGGSSCSANPAPPYRARRPSTTDASSPPGWTYPT